MPLWYILKEKPKTDSLGVERLGVSSIAEERLD